MTMFVQPQDVRGYLNIRNASRNYSDGNLGSNIRAASSFLQRATGRQFEPQNGVTKKFTTNGEPYLAVPDFRTVNSISLQGSALVADSTYWPIPDRMNSGVYVGIQLRPYGSYDHRSNPDWFDRNLDQPWWRGYGGSLPNDLSMTCDWGWSPYPEELLLATKILAGFIAKLPDSLLAKLLVTPEGAVLSYAGLPDYVTTFITEWKLGGPMATVVG